MTATVIVLVVKAEVLQVAIQEAKDNGQRILALSPAKIYRTKVTEYTLVVQ